MKLGRNLAAGFANSAWTAVLGLAVVPIYLRFLGIEAYGLIGFFATLQALFGLLDVGLAPTMNREVARSSTRHERSQVRDLLHTIAVTYWIVAGLISFVTILTAPLIAAHWFHATQLQTAGVVQALTMMGVIIGFRFPIGLYLGALMGAQRMVTASGIEMAMGTFSSVGGVLVVAFVSPTIQAFFLWQALAAILNVALVRAAAWRALDESADGRKPRLDLPSLRRIWRFAAGIAITAVIATLILQSDKLILSKMVGLEALGRYTLAALASRSLLLFVTPAFGAIYPRLTELQAAGEIEEMKLLYKSGTRLLMAAICPVAAYMGVFSTEIFTIWTHDPRLAASLHVTVILLLVGTALQGAMHFPFALQLAHGNSRLTVLINVILLIIYAPVVVVLTLGYGITGAAAAWAILNVLFLLLGTWLTHRTLLRGEGLRWVTGDVAIPFFTAAVVCGGGGVLIQSLDLSVAGRLSLGALSVGFASMSVVALSPNLRRRIPQLKVR